MSKSPIQLFVPLLLALLILGCSSSRSSEMPVGSSVLSGANEDIVSTGDFDMDFSFEEGPEDDRSGAPPFVLSEGLLGWDVGEKRPPLAETTPMTADQIQQVLARLAPLQEDESDALQFKLPDQSLPPPRPGSEVELSFPPTASEAAPDTQLDAALEVLRFSPHGNVPLAPQLSVTFSHPMVPLTSHLELAEEDIPVRLDPPVPGKWRWVGTRTLLFEAQLEGIDRMPMATEYTAVIPAGTKSADGSELSDSVQWTFRTPAPTLQSAYPIGGPVDIQPVLFASFDQSIDAASVLKNTQLSAQGRSYPVRNASEDEIAASPRVQRLIAKTAQNRRLAFVPVDPLPRNTTVTVTFLAGTPSTEGPLVTAHPQGYSFKTPGPFLLQQRECGWSGEAICPPNSPLALQFSNPIDTETFDPSLISISPEPAYVSYEVFDNTIWIAGTTTGRSTYQVTVDASLTDRFGQTLEEDVQVEFTIGPAEAFLTAASRGPITVLDPYGPPAFPVYTVNVFALKARAYRVDPEQFIEYLQWRNELWRDEQVEPPGELVLERSLEISRQLDEMVETEVDLTNALDGNTGHLILYVEPEFGLLSPLLGSRLQDMRVVSWVQVTNIGLDAFVDADEMLVWTNSLADGSPLTGVEVDLWPQKAGATTGDSGTALLPLPRSSSQLLIGRYGDDIAFLPENRYEYYRTDNGWNGWRQREQESRVRFYVFDDRNMYRPGESVSVKGWLRNIERNPAGSVNLLPQSASHSLQYTVRDSSNNLIDTDTVSLTALGGFHLQFEIPDNVNLGHAWIEFRYTADQGESHHGHVFQIQEFRRPEFEVGATVNEGPHFAGGSASAAVSASYFAGGPLPSAEVVWNVEATEGAYQPPNWSDFNFGKWFPWWRYGRGSSFIGRASFNSRTDASGRHVLKIDFNGDSGSGQAGSFPTHIDATATVFDVNRQAWSSSTGFVLHPADRYVGLRAARLFVDQGQPLSVDVVVTDIDGNVIEGQQAVVRAALLDWEFSDDMWRQVETETQHCTVETTSASDQDNPDHSFASCSFDTKVGGEYRITATVADGAGRSNQSELSLWVTGGSRPPSGFLEREELQLIPETQDYAPGDLAEILIQAPFYPAQGLLTLRRDGLVSSQRFSMDGPTYTLLVPIEESYIPNVRVQVDLVGASERVDLAGNPLPGLPARPAYARGRLNLSIPPLSRTLHVAAVPRAARLSPGAETTIDVTVLDHKGAPVPDAEFAVVVVDEAVLALTGYQLLDPISVFYSDRSAGVNDFQNRGDILLANPQTMSDELAVQTVRPQAPATTKESASMAMADSAEAAPMAAVAESAMDDEMAEEEGAADSDGDSIRVRLNFDPLALFAPEVRTGQDGRASVALTLPDNLTRYRVMVVAVSGGQQFGAGEANLTARLPLMVRPSAPRFLNFGDSFQLPVVLQNQTDEDIESFALVRASNAILTADGVVNGAAGYKVTVPANDRVEVRFPTTTASAGTARFQFGVVDANQPATSDAAEVDLPVFTPATTEAFAVYGEIDEDGAILQPLRPPTDAIEAYGGLEVTLSSTALQALTDAFLYLVRYPYESSEQIASRILAVAALRDVLTAFDAAGLPSSDEIDSRMDSDLQTLGAMQDYGGGFPLWRRGAPIWPYHSVHVAHALARARLKGYPVPEEMVSRSLAYLQSVEQQFPSWYGDDTRRGLSAYALYVRKLLNDHDPAKAHALLSETSLESFPLESLGWLLFVLTDDAAAHQTVSEIRRFLNNRVTETAGAATYASSYTDGDYLLLHSTRRADAVLLEALVLDQPESDLIGKLVKGLLGHRTAGRWSNTQENVWVLLAMDRYFAQFEAQSPDFVARIWLGEQFAAGHPFQGRSTENVGLDIPMQFLSDISADTNDDIPLTILKEGPGRLYYRLGLRYAPTDLALDPADHGFTVERTYEAIDDPADVTRDENDTWRIRAGARVRVRLTMAAPARRVHVALVDHLPAGLEILNPDLAVTADPPRETDRASSGRWWWSSWYQHQNLRDDRAEAFTSYLWAGVYEYSYYAQATTPGAFIAPPAKAEEMYAPETFGRTGTEWVVVEIGEE